MIKVLRIINRFNLGGPTHNAAYLTKYLPDEYETLLIGGVPEQHEADSLHIVKNLGIEPLIIPEMSRSVNIFKDIKSYFKIRRIIKNYRPQIVHTHASKAGLLGRLAAIHENVPVIVHTFHGHVFHSYFHPIITQSIIQIERYLAKKSSAIIAISQKQKDELCNEFQIVPPDKVEVIPLGLDLKKFAENKSEKRKLFRTKYNISENTIAIGIAGRLVPIKNHHLLIDAVKHLKTLAQQNFEVIIIGDGELKNELKNYIKEQGMNYREHPEENSADFYFTSWIKEMDVAYAGLDIVTLCSKNEGTPVSLLEAQAAGKMIVTTNVGGVKDIVLEGASIILDDFNPLNYASALLHCIQNYTSVNQFISDNISPKIIQQYSYETLVANMDRLYKNLLSK
ncbi:MAG: glycosyltransferase family 4 protein [Bacteroidia bacterium]